MLNRENLYRLISTLNLFLCLSVGALAFYLFSASKRPYQPRMKEFESADIAPSQGLREAPELNDRLFNSKRLFNTSLAGKQEKKKNTLVLLGVSLGKRNLAVIRDTAALKDYYCASGDSIGPFKVKRILKDRVILESEGNTLELIK
jgi:type II secretory pathway component PulC